MDISQYAHICLKRLKNRNYFVVFLRDACLCMGELPAPPAPAAPPAPHFVFLITL